LSPFRAGWLGHPDGEHDGVGTLVFAGALAHVSLLARGKDMLEPAQRERLYGAIDAFGAALRAAQPDALVVFGADHYNTFFLDTMPAFCVGIGERTRSWGDAGLPERDTPIHDALGRAIVETGFEDGLDPAYAYDMRVDHAFASPLSLLVDERIPLVPVIVNCTAPPLPPARRAYALGRSVRRATAACDQVGRVAVIGTGGISHTVPIPKLGVAGDELDARMVEVMKRGRSASVAFEPLLREKVTTWVREQRGRVDEEFDREFLAFLDRGAGSAYAERVTTAWIEEHGGNGGQEVRTWLAAAAAAGDAGGELLYYEPLHRFLTGVGVYRFRVA
jgi:2,3-dihydroxyphenylpropionate 1,2-dioxygenase